MTSDRQPQEALLISAVLNSGDAFTAKEYGVRSEHFRGFRDEYDWIIAYEDQYRQCPSPTQLDMKFDDFPYDPTATEARWAAHEVKRAWAARDLLKRTRAATEELVRGNVEQAYEEIKGATLEVVSARPEAALSDSAFLDGYGDPQDERIEVPWRTLQKITNGIGPGELWYLAARQGNGKTSYLIDIAVDAAFNGHRVCFYSMEMTKRQIQVRAQAAFAYRLGIKVDEHQMLHRTYDQGDYKELLGQIGDKMDQSGGAFNVHVPSMGRVTPGVIASLAGEYDLHLIDYIGLMATDAGDPAVGDWRYAAEISNTLKQIALAKNTSIFSASQVNRDGDTIQNKPPKLKNLAQSDHLGNDGDVVLTMKRYGMGAGIFSVEKNRHGPSLNVFFTEYDPNQGNFSEITVDRANTIKDDTDARDY